MNTRSVVFGLTVLAVILGGLGNYALAKQPAGTPRQTAPQGVVLQIIVKLRDPITQRSNLAQIVVSELSGIAGVNLTYFRRMSGGAHVLRLPAPLTLPEARLITERLSKNPLVEFAEPDYVMHAMLIPNDPRYNEQWHYTNPTVTGFYGINAPGAWDITTGDPSVVTAVIDTGLLSHVDIDTNINDSSGRVTSGYDFITDSTMAGDGNGRDANPTDAGDFAVINFCGPGEPAEPSSWHGTHVAGTIGALTNNGVGVSGINWLSKIQPIRVLGKCGGAASDIGDGVAWAAGLPVPGLANNPTPAKVLNLSLGVDAGVPCDAATQAAIDAILATGAVIVVAAGNGGDDGIGDNVDGAIPANCNGVITVAATDVNGEIAVYSNFGNKIEISAPGGDGFAPPIILSTHDGGTTAAANDNAYNFLEGTSMATPHVAGVVSLMLSKNPTITAAQVLSLLQSTARAFPNTGTPFECDTANCGAGIVDATAAVAAVPALPDTTPDAFTFVDQPGVVQSAVITSAPVTIAGINQPASISAGGAEYSIGCTAIFMTAASTIANGQTACVRHTSGSAPSTAVNTTLTVGGVSDIFTSTTFGTDSTPDAFTFVDQSGVVQSTVIVSAPVTITGIDQPAPISAGGDEYSIDCTTGFTTAASTITNGQTVCVRHTSAATLNTAVDTTLTVGGVSDIFTSTTAGPDTTPDTFAFVDRLGVAQSTVIVSAPITISGINQPAAISAGGDEYSIDCTASFVTAASTITNGQTACVRHTSAAASNTSVNTTLTVGGVSDTFRSTTANTGGGGGGGGDGDSGSGEESFGSSDAYKCFIATAAYGSYMHPHVKSLRDFRDQHLLPYKAGQWFVRNYYKYSPSIAQLISQHEVLRFMVRTMLFPIVVLVEHPAPSGALVLALGMLIGAQRMRIYRPGSAI